jgi:hypothetical protein
MRNAHECVCMAETWNRLSQLLVGDDFSLTKRWGAIATGLFVVVFAIFVSGY